MKRLIFSVLLTLMAVIFASSLVFALTNPIMSTTDLTTVTFKANTDEATAQALTSKSMTQGQLAMNTGISVSRSHEVATHNDSVYGNTATTANLTTTAQKIAKADATYTELKKNQGILAGADVLQTGSAQIVISETHLSKLAARANVACTVSFNLRL